MWVIPRVLSDPPWRVRTHLVARPSLVARGTSTCDTKLVWEDGERARFAGKATKLANPLAEEKLFERLLDELDKKTPLKTDDVARLGDEKLAELAEELGPTNVHVQTMKLVLARLGDSIASHAVTIVRAAPRERLLFEAAMPIRLPDLARNAAAIFFERELPKETYALSEAEQWMLRHAHAAACGLAGASSDAARAGLAFMAAFGKLDDMRGALADDAIASLEPFAALAPLAARDDKRLAVVLAARGADARAVALLEKDPEAAAWVARVREGEAKKQLDAVPEAVAPLPAFFDPSALPRPTLRGGTALPDDAVRALGEMLRFSPLKNPYVGVAQVQEACDAESLDAFVLALFERWREAGEDPRDVWALEACGKIGGDASAREMATRVRSWARGADPPRYGWDHDAHRQVLVAPGSRGYAYARAGASVLASIAEHGTGDAREVARLAIEDIAKTGVQAWLRKVAHELLGDADVKHDEIDAPVPTVGLDDDGSATLELSVPKAGSMTRSYRVKFTEDLTPYLTDEHDKRIESLPKQRKDDDAKKYATAKDRWTTIVKDSKIVARFQTALLQSMMVSQRTFTSAQFLERFVKHPLLRHLGRRVVWSASPGDVSLAFRVAEDGSFADVHDAAFALGHHAVTVAHPVLMDRDTLAAWRTRFHDYMLMQPFPQLEREIFVCSAKEIGEHDIPDIAGRKTSRGRLFQLRNWRLRYDEDENASEYVHELSSGANARILVEPPVTNDAKDGEVFTITRAMCTHTLDRLSRIDYSELRRDIERASVSKTSG